MRTDRCLILSPVRSHRSWCSLENTHISPWCWRPSSNYSILLEVLPWVLHLRVDRRLYYCDGRFRLFLRSRWSINHFLPWFLFFSWCLLLNIRCMSSLYVLFELCSTDELASTCSIGAPIRFFLCCEGILVALFLLGHVFPLNVVSRKKDLMFVFLFLFLLACRVFVVHLSIIRNYLIWNDLRVPRSDTHHLRMNAYL